jgi:hypothetical protein
MLKRLLLSVGLIGVLAATGCCGGGGCLRCETPCYGKNLCRHGRQMTDFLDVYFMNYDRHDPYRCDPCAGD